MRHERTSPLVVLAALACIPVARAATADATTPFAFLLDHWQFFACLGAVVAALAVCVVFLLLDRHRRRNLERQIDESEARHRRFVESFPDIVYTYSTRRGALYWSSRVKDILGIEPSELIKSPFLWHDAIHPDDVAVANAAIAHSATGQDFDIEYRIRDTAGNWRWLHDRSISRRNVNGETIIEGVATDITERKHAERALRKSEREKDLILNSTAEMFAYYDTDLRLRWANKASGDSVGKRAEELVGLHCYEIWHGRDEPCPDCPVLKARDTRTEQQTEVVTPDGRHWHLRGYPVLDERGDLVGLIEYGQDVTERKRAELALRESEEKYRDLFERNQAIKLVIDPTDGRIVDASPGAARFYGYSREQLRVMKITDINTATPDEICEEKARAAYEAKGYFEFQHRLANGEVRDVEVHSSPFTSGGRQLLYSIVHDITVRKQATTAIQLERAFMQAILDTDPNTIFVKDNAGRFVVVNQACADLFNTTPADLVGRRNIEVLQNPGEDEGYSRVDLEVIRSGIPQVLEELHQRVDGGRTWFLTHKARITLPNGTFGVLGVCVDLTERKLAEQALRKNSQLLADAERMANMGAWSWDVEQDRWSVSDSWLAMHGCVVPPRAMDDLLPLAHPDDLPKIRAAFDAALAGRGPYRVEHRIIRQDNGEVRIIDAFGKVSFNEHGQPSYLIGAAFDITQRKQLEAQQRELEQQVQVARRFESLATMAGAIAHKFNNILTAILGNLDFALDARHVDASARESIEHAQQAAREAAELSRLMLVYVGQGQDRHRRFCLSELLNDNRRRLEQLVAHDTRLVLDSAGGGELSISGDRARISEAVVNLVTNASEAIGRTGGQVTVRTARVALSTDELADSYIIEKPPAGDFACLTVADDGCGMNEETRLRLFEPYYSTKFTGRGLGLAAVLGIIRGHNGAIFVDSEESVGTTIRLLLPIAEDSEQQPPPTRNHTDTSPAQWVDSPVSA